MRIKILLFISIILFPAIAQGQVAIVNALPEIQEKEELGWSTAIAISGKYRDDNSRERKLNLSLSGSSTYRANGWLIHTLAKSTYEWIDGFDQEANTLGHIRFRLNPYKLFNPNYSEKSEQHWLNRLHLEAFAQHEYDKFRALDTRALTGTGIVYIFETKHMDIAIGTAYMIEYINFYNSNKEELNYRLSNYLQLEIDPTDTIAIESITFVQFRVDNLRDILIMTSLGLKIKATEWFGIRLTFGIDYDSRPPPNVKNVGVGTGADIIVEF